MPSKKVGEPAEANGQLPRLGFFNHQPPLQMYNFQTGSHGPERDVERETAVYTSLLAKYEALRFAADQGVFSVTVTSDAGTITVPVSYLDGRQIAVTLAEQHAEWIAHIETGLNYSLEAVADELRAERKEQDAKRRRRDAEAAAERVNDERRELATAAAAQVSQPQPAQRPVGRPSKKAAAVLGQAAAAVPMNGSTAHAAARATSSTPQA